MSETYVVIVRGVIAFFTLLIFARLLGKQQISQMTFFDYILGITIGSIASSLTTDLSSTAWPHWVGLITWVVLVLLLQLVTLRWRYLSKYIDGEPAIVIMNGKIMEKVMKKLRFRMDDLNEQLRQKDIFDLTEVKYAILEKNGKISVLKNPENETVTVKDMNLAVQNNNIATELIYNGIVIEQNLRQLNLSAQWLKEELQKQNISSPSQVFFMTATPDKKIYIDKYEDHIENPTNVSDYKGPY